MFCFTIWITGKWITTKPCSQASTWNIKLLVDQLSKLGYLPWNKDSGEFNVLFSLTSMQESFWNWIQITDCFTNERIDLSMIVYFIAYSLFGHVSSAHAHKDSNDRLNPVWTGRGSYSGLTRFATQRNLGIYRSISLLFVTVSYITARNTFLLSLLEFGIPKCNIPEKTKVEMGALC